MPRYARFITALSKIAMVAISKKDEQLQTEVFRLFCQMGGIYVKFLQILVTNTTFFSSLSPSQKLSVFSDSAPSPIDYQAVLRSQLTPEALGQILTINPKPFATGSFANVYLAQLTNGTQIIIKIKRPGLEKQLRQDIFILRCITFIVSLSRSVSDVNVGQVAKEYAHGIKAETNYRQEVRNALRFFDEYRSHPTIVIPKTYRDLSTHDIIIQEFIDGITMSHLLMHKENAHALVSQHLGSDFNTQLHTLGVDTLARVFAGKVIHGDPHPGNIVLLPNNKVCFIDFGILSKPSKDPGGYFNYMHEQTIINHGTLRPGKFALSMLRVYSPRLYHSMRFIDVRLPKPQILQQVETALDKNFYLYNQNAEKVLRSMQQGHTTEKFLHALNPQGTLPFSIQIDGATLYRACHVIWSTIIKFDLYEELIPHIYDEAVKRATASSNSIDYKGAPHSYEEAVEIILEWAELVREKDPIFFAYVKQMLPALGV